MYLVYLLDFKQRIIAYFVHQIDCVRGHRNLAWFLGFFLYEQLVDRFA
jgi:hypothetical protein